MKTTNLGLGESAKRRAKNQAKADKCREEAESALRKGKATQANDWLKLAESSERAAG